MNFDPQKFIEFLPYMGEGMACILVVMGVIILATALLNKVTSKK